MKTVGEVALVVAIACIAVANMVGNAMTRLVYNKTGKEYWPPAVNARLARDYRENFGADRNYVYYGIMHFASLISVVVAVFVLAIWG
jgi:hypothetical protein